MFSGNYMTDYNYLIKLSRPTIDVGHLGHYGGVSSSSSICSTLPKNSRPRSSIRASTSAATSGEIYFWISKKIRLWRRPSSPSGRSLFFFLSLYLKRNHGFMVSKTKKTKKRKRVQRKIISFHQELVIAPPGCGKTELLASEIAKELKAEELKAEEPEKEKRILCLTFTDQAAREMESRVVSHGGNARAETLFIGTLHSYCLRELSKQGSIAVIDDELFEEFADMKDPSDTAHLSLREFNRKYSSGKYRLEIPEQMLVQKAFQMKLNRGRFTGVKRWSPARNKKLEYYTRRYNQYKQDLNKPAPNKVDQPRYMDFNDLLWEAWRALQGGAWDTGSKYDIVFVDEVQDLTGLQLKIIKKLVSSGGTIRYYGDPQQAIYSFMGAKARQLISLSKQCRKTRTRRINYRSPEYLVKAINRYASDCLSLEKDWGKFSDVWMQKSSAVMQRTPLVDHATAVLRASSFEKEVDGIVHLIDSFPTHETNAILVRDNERVKKIVEELKKKNKYIVVESKDMVHTYPLKLMANHIKLILDFTNLDKWRRMLPFILRCGPQIDPGLFNTMNEFSIFPFLMMFGEIPEYNKAGAEPLLNRMGMRILQHKLEVKYTPLVKKYREDLQRVGESKEPKRLNQLVLDRVAAWYQAFVDAGYLPPHIQPQWHAAKGIIHKRMNEKFPMNNESVIDEEAVKERLRFIASECGSMRSEQFLKKANTFQRLIYVMTVHQAKGRGFDNVFMFEARKDVYRPNKKEDRRLYYVGITRAIKRIILSLSCDEDRLEDLRSDAKEGADLRPRYGMSSPAYEPWSIPGGGVPNDNISNLLFDPGDVSIP